MAGRRDDLHSSVSAIDIHRSMEVVLERSSSLRFFISLFLEGPKFVYWTKFLVGVVNCRLASGWFFRL